MDDGSPDRCGEICDEYSKIDDRIRVIHKSNGGQAQARNRGLDICRGEYVVFLDSDDFLSSDYLGYLVETADKYKADKFILISTDKAVNPTSTMGATKRICEMIIQSMNEISEHT